MGRGARDRARGTHRPRAVAGEIRPGPAAGGSHRALQGAALLPALHEHDPALARLDVAGAAPLRGLAGNLRTALQASASIAAIRALRTCAAISVFALRAAIFPASTPVAAPRARRSIARGM